MSLTPAFHRQATDFCFRRPYTKAIARWSVDGVPPCLTVFLAGSTLASANQSTGVELSRSLFFDQGYEP